MAMTARQHERPGLATAFGEEHHSSAGVVAFERENPRKPMALATVHYNDRAGTENRYGGQRTISLHPLIRFGVEGDEGHPYPIVWQGGLFQPRYSVIGESGARYILVLTNESDSRMEFVVSVDGLDVIDGRPAAVTKGGYIVNPGRTLRIDGWRTGRDAVAAFRFSSVSDSYAERRYGDTRNVGVIGIAALNERGSHPRPYLERERRLRKKADPFPGGHRFAEPPSRSIPF